MKRLLLACFLAVACAAAFGQTAADAQKIGTQIDQLRADLIKQARDSGANPNYQEIAQKVQAKLNDLIKDVDVGKIDAKDAYLWARLFQSAGKNHECCDLARKFLTTNPADPIKFQAMYLMAQSCNAEGEADSLASTLDTIPVPDANSSRSLASMTTNVYVDTIYEKKGLEPALKTLDSVEKKVLLEDPKDYAKRVLASEKSRPQTGTNPPKSDADRLAELEKAGKQMNETEVFSFASKRAELLADAGKKNEAKKVLTSAMAKIPEDSPVHRNAQMALTRMTLEGSVAPMITAERSHGDFKGLESMRGKVVIVDFFAHWCGPCIASFPDMEQMYGDLHSKGLEVVSVTTYYGYYKGEGMPGRTMDKDTEFAKMAEFKSEHKMPWSVVLGDRSNMEEYGVNAIPTAILIDRKGVIHSVHVGYSKDSFAEFRKQVEELLASGE